MPFNLSTWEGVEGLRKGEPDYLIDTAAANLRLSKRNGNPYRRHVCTFPVERDMSPSGFEKRCKEAIETFLEAMRKSGWELASPLSFERRDLAVDMEKGYRPECFEYRVSGVFKCKPEAVRIEVPPQLVRKDPEQTISLREAMHAW